MVIRKPIRKAAKFAFVSIPAGLAGWQLNKHMFMWLRSFWKRSVSPACPECDAGVMLCDNQAESAPDAAGDTKRLYPWVCNHCSYAILETADVSQVRAVVTARRNERARAMFSDLQLQERDVLARRHKIGARIFYVFSLLTFINFVHMLATGAAFIVAINWAAFALMFAVFGMKKVYRAWQVTSGQLFKTGAFWHWLKHEKWLA
jgi:hypothetical protein